MSSGILVVDDDPSIRDLIGDLLGEAGFSVLAVGGGREAVECVRAERPELVLLDLRMPGMDGWEVQARLREVDPDLPVVFMTAAPRARVEAETHHAAGYLGKPFDLDSL